MAELKVIGVDIGGSHITSSIVDLNLLNLIEGSTFSVKVDNKASKDNILKCWSMAVNQSIEYMDVHDEIRIGFAMPGPFNYKKGLGMFIGNNQKYESLNGVSIPAELSKYLHADKMDFRFLNDATAFGVGVASMGKAKDYSKVVAITLGTGFGSAFLQDGVPQVTVDNVPKGGFMWDKPYKLGLGDDYFSTRWCVKRYKEITGEETIGVKEIAEANNDSSRKVFLEFGSNMAEFMLPFLIKYQPDLIILGGNVSKASALFLPALKNKIKDTGLQVDFEISDVLEEAAIIGSAKLYDSYFWEQLKNTIY
ncbi:ROK family protein [Arenibacter sp. BSSL-BM3]|uniref:ROK family protein n=1 Tax=Arenibacter arenosicollis TaxID=2762274 RepID=A0ABR7QTL6_9FLAO|nr:ROK family protein [Arenibacter arenosicollis]MBC8770530.1 ROK family protein [Arenibacter arenosicollis]